MRTWARFAGALLIALALMVGVAACGGDDDDDSSTTAQTSGGSGTSEEGGRTGGTVQALQGTAPDYLDPQLGYTTQAVQSSWISYTPLVTYAHEAGEGGTRLIPGLAEALPTISDDGLRYDFVLRRGLRFSDGTPVRAADAAFAIERAIRINWGGKSFYTNYIEGARDFDLRRADRISGIRIDEATGRISFTLTEPYGAFANVLAFPSSGLVPTGTALRNLSNDPPPGVGPYMITDVVPNQSYVVRRNPEFEGLAIPDIPVGSVDEINVRIVSNVQSGAQQVLNDQADVFDPGDTLPPSLLPQIESQASDRFSRETAPSSYYFFLNTTIPPFDNEQARIAVNMALDRGALQRLASGFTEPTCFFIPRGLVGHPESDCPHGPPTTEPDVEGARRLIRDAGLEGERVTVWGQQRSPRKEFVDYYTDVLNDIGFDAQQRIIADAVYFPTIGSAETNPQTGFASWFQDFPNPSDFYLLLDARSIQPTNNQNFSQVDDPFIQREIIRLNRVPATELESVADDWRRLDEYTAERAYIAAFAEVTLPKFMSRRIDFDAAIFHPLYQNDWTSFQLK